MLVALDSTKAELNRSPMDERKQLKTWDEASALFAKHLKPVSHTPKRKQMRWLKN